jgi:hypothetical protein
MNEWQPIESAAEWLRTKGMSALLEKSSEVCTWGPLLVFCPKSEDASGAHIFVAKFVDWGDDSKHSHWRDANSLDDDCIKPTHWMPVPAPPK